MRQSGESDLVVHNHVHGSARAVGAQLGHLQCLQNNALSRHGGVTVDENGKNTEATDFFPVLLGSNDSLEDTIDRFEVGGVRCQVDGNLTTGRARVDAFSSQVILHIP